MKNKSMAVVAALLLSVGIAFSFAGTGSMDCCASSAGSCNASAQTCCDMPCPPDGCPIGCCEE